MRMELHVSFVFDVEENRRFLLLEIRPNQRDSSDSDGDDSSGHVSGPSVSLTEKSLIDVVLAFFLGDILSKS